MCADGERRDAEEWSVGNKGHPDHNGQLTPLSHGGDGDGNGFDQSFLVLLLLRPFYCSSVVVAVDVCVVAVAGAVGAAAAAAVDAAAAAVVVDVAAAVFLGTSPTDCPNLLHFLLQTLQH